MLERPEIPIWRLDLRIKAAIVNAVKFDPGLVEQLDGRADDSGSLAGQVEFRKLEMKKSMDSKSPA